MKRFFLSLFSRAVSSVLFSGAGQAAPGPREFYWAPRSTPGQNHKPGSLATLTNEPGRTVTTDGTFITATNITVTSNAPTGFPDKFMLNGNVGFTLKLTDLSDVSHPAMSFLFTGTFNTTDPLFPSTVSSESS